MVGVFDSVMLESAPAISIRSSLCKIWKRDIFQTINDELRKIEILHYL